MRTLLTISLSACLAMATLTGCGFRPLHEAATSQLDASISPLSSMTVEPSFSDDADNKQAAFFIAKALRERIGTPGPDRSYRLLLSPAVSRGGLGVGRNDVASRYDYNVYTTYRLLAAEDGKVVTKGRVYSVATYGAPIDPYGRITAEISASEQASKQAADKILTDIAVHFAQENRKKVDADTKPAP